MASAFWVVVLREFDADGVTLQANDIVDAADWRTRESLIRQRWIRPATPQEVAAAEEAEEETPPPPKAKVKPRSKNR